MALADMLEGNGGWGLGVGLLAGAAIVLTKQGRPLVKSAMVGYLTVSDRVRALAAETAEQMQDLYEEARAEYQDRLAAEEAAETVDVVEEEAPPPPPKRPRAGRGARAATAVVSSE